jgi:hypothetical protein
LVSKERDKRGVTLLPSRVLNSMAGCNEWKPFIAMITVDFAFSIVNILLKKVLDEGINHLVLITYRLSISALFLGPIGYFWER